MKVLYAACLAAAMLVAAAPATCSAAQGYPERPVRLLVPYPPGGATDFIARALAQKLAPSLGQQIVVDNRGGGAQIIGTDIVAKAAPDGYTILLASVTHAINPTLQRRLPYDSVADFASVTLLGMGQNVLVVHPSIPARSVSELVKLLKASPGKYNYASSGIGSGGHLAMEMFKDAAGIEITHVPYKGNGPATIDLLANQVRMMFTSTAPMLPHIKGGRLRALATTGEKRTGAMPDVPTIAESGFPGYEASLWYAILAPAKTPAAVVRLLNARFVDALNSKDIRERFAARGIDVAGSTPEFFDRYLRTETAKWEKVIRKAQIRPE